jgi:hypothetical protein
MGGGGAGWTSAGSNLSAFELNYECSTSRRASRSTTKPELWRRSELLPGLPVRDGHSDPCFDDDINMHSHSYGAGASVSSIIYAYFKHANFISSDTTTI